MSKIHLSQAQCRYERASQSYRPVTRTPVSVEHTWSFAASCPVLGWCCFSRPSHSSADYRPTPSLSAAPPPSQFSSLEPRAPYPPGTTLAL